MKNVMTLLYHRVNILEHDLHKLAVSPTNFYEQMCYLKKTYNIVRFEDNWSKIDKNSVAITFDDGYFDNYQLAVPILEKLQIPATIFVSTGTMNQKSELWWDELERLVLSGNQFKDSFLLKDSLFACKWELDSPPKREEMYYTLHWLMYNKIDIKKREEWMNQLRKWRGFTEDAREINYTISEAQCKEISQSLYVTIGAHTINHPSLKNLPKIEQRKEIISSKNRLEEIIRKKVCTFSYPFGGKGDYSQETLEICKEAGFVKVAANFPALWKSDLDNYQVPRVIVRDWKLTEFIEEIEKAWSI